MLYDVAYCSYYIILIGHHFCLQCDVILISQIFTTDITELAREGKIGNVFCELRSDIYSAPIIYILPLSLWETFKIYMFPGI